MRPSDRQFTMTEIVIEFEAQPEALTDHTATPMAPHCDCDARKFEGVRRTRIENSLRHNRFERANVLL